MCYGDRSRPPSVAIYSSFHRVRSPLDSVKHSEERGLRKTWQGATFWDAQSLGPPATTAIFLFLLYNQRIGLYHSSHQSHQGGLQIMVSSMKYFYTMRCHQNSQETAPQRVLIGYFSKWKKFPSTSKLRGTNKLVLRLGGTK